MQEQHIAGWVGALSKYLALPHPTTWNNSEHRSDWGAQLDVALGSYPSQRVRVKGSLANPLDWGIPSWVVQSESLQGCCLLLSAPTGPHAGLGHATAEGALDWGQGSGPS